MTVNEFRSALGLTVLVGGYERCPVETGYTCDLLSWVMTRLPKNAAWFTVMGNKNAIAVASLMDAACIVLVDGATLDTDARIAAMREKINVYQSLDGAYTLSARLSNLLK